MAVSTERIRMTRVCRMAFVVGWLALGLGACGGSASPTAPTCTGFTYLDWGACLVGGTQTRAVLSALPAGCTGGSRVTSQSCTYPPPVYTITVNKYVNTEGAKGSYTTTVTGGPAVNICVGDLGLSGVDPDRIVLRDASSGGRIGSFIAIGNSGCVTFTPTSSKTIDAFVFSTLGGAADYSKVDKGIILFSRNVAVFVEPAYPGNSTELQALTTLLAQFNAALAPDWMTYGGLSVVQGTGDLGFQFRPITYCGAHTTSYKPNWILIGSDSCAAIPRNILGVMIEELFESLTNTCDIDAPPCGKGGTWTVRINDNALSDAGRAYLTYVYIKHSMGW